MKVRASSVIGVVVVAVILWWLLRPTDHKAVHGDVELGVPTVVASDPHVQADSDYYTSSTPGSFD